MLCRGGALHQVVNAGPSEGIQPWRQLILERVGSRFAGQLMNLLDWSFSDDVVTRLEVCERGAAQCRHSSGETRTDTLRIGALTRHMIGRTALSAPNLESCASHCLEGFPNRIGPRSSCPGSSFR